MPALWACSLRLALASLILFAIMAATRQEWPRGPALKAACLYGFFEFGLSLPLLYWGEKAVPSGLAAVVYAICPVIAMFEARLLGMEKLSAKRLFAAAFAFAGVGVIFWNDIFGRSGWNLISVLLAAITAPAAGLFLQRGPKQSAVTVNAVGALVGLPFALAGSFMLRESHEIPQGASQVFPILYLVLAGSVGAFVIFAWLINYWKTTTVAFLGVIVPVIAVILGSLVRSEAVGLNQLLGGAIVLIAVTFALRSEISAPLAQEA